MTEPTTVSVEPGNAAYLRAALNDIAKGRWNTGARLLDTPDNMTALQYAQAALRNVPVYVGPKSVTRKKAS